MKDHMETMLRKEISSDSPILTWLAMHAAHILNYYKVLENGRTPYELITWHGLKAVVVSFGDNIHFLTAPDRNKKALTGWKSGVFLGVNAKTIELLVGMLRAYGVRSR